LIKFYIQQRSWNIQFSKVKTGPAAASAPIAVEILLRRGSAQKIATPVRLRSGGAHSRNSSKKTKSKTGPKKQYYINTSINK
jgi:hypothetical protein